MLVVFKWRSGNITTKPLDIENMDKIQSANQSCIRAVVDWIEEEEKLHLQINDQVLEATIIDDSGDIFMGMKFKYALPDFN